MRRFEGKIVVVTGGSSGIGLATAKRFADEGAHVVITGRREKELKDTAASIGRNVTTVMGDVSRLEDLDWLYAHVEETHGHIDILFANAGAGTVASLTWVRWTSCWTVRWKCGNSGRVRCRSAASDHRSFVGRRLVKRTKANW